MPSPAPITEEVDVAPPLNTPKPVGRPRKYRVSWPAGGEGVPTVRILGNQFNNWVRTLPPWVDEIERKFGHGARGIYRRMAETHPQISSALDVLVLLALSQEMQIEPGNIDGENDPEYEDAKLYSDHCRAQMDRLSESFQETLYEMDYDASVDGHKYAELVWEMGTLDPGQGEQMLLKAIKPKPKDSYWLVTDYNNNLLGLLPRNIYTSQPYVGSFLTLADIQDQIIPPSKFLKRVNHPQDGSPQGQSDLRDVYHSWWQFVSKIPDHNAFLATCAQPNPVWEDDPAVQWSAPADPATGIVPDRADYAIGVLSKIRNGSPLYIPAGQLKYLEPKTNGQVFEQSFDRDDRAMMRGLTNQELATGQAQYQPRASTETHRDIMALKPRYHAGQLAHIIERDLFRSMLLYNYGEKALRHVPRALMGQTAQWDLGQVGQVIAQMLLAKGVFPSQMPRLHVMANMPPASRSDYEQYGKLFWATLPEREQPEPVPGAPAPQPQEQPK